MKYFLILLLSVGAFAQQKPVRGLDRKFEAGKWHRIPMTAIPSDRTNVLISITSTNWPKQPQIGTLQLSLSWDIDAVGQVWTPRTFDLSSAAGNSVTVNVPLDPPRGNKRRYVKGIVHANRNFDAVIEVK